MRDINDDMDDLFRRAADKYPLNTNSSDWNKVQTAMQFSEKGAVQVKSKKKYRRFLWLLLLLPFAFVIEKYGLQNHDKRSSGIAKNDEVASSEQKKVFQKNIENKNLNKKGEVIPGSLNKLNKKNPSSSTRIIQNKTSDEIDKESVNQINNESFVSVNRIKNIQNKYSPKQNDAINKTVVAEDLDKVKKDVITIEEKDSNPSAINKDFDGIKNIGIKEDSTDAADKVEIKKVESTPAVTNDTLRKDITRVHKKDNLKKDKSHTFYIGIVAGPDFSKVKLEKIIKTGYTVGAIAGYRFNKKWSIESGMLIEKKYYYSEGKYFNAKNIYLPSYTKLDDVDGDCHMIEFPLNVKYDFKSSKKVNWFAIAGLSSYFMSKENYQYRYNSYGWQVEKSLSIKDASKIWASVMNFSLGYSHKIGSTGSLRIEPYIKIPVRGIGTGSLPITSSGIYFGFTKNLF